MDGRDFLRKLFEDISRRVDSGDLSKRVLRSFGAGGKGLVDQGMKEFPQERIAELVDTLYGLIVSRDLAEDLSAAISSFDEQKVSDILRSAVENLKDEKVSLQVARQLRGVLNQASNDDIIGGLRMIVSAVNMPQVTIVFDALSFQASLYLDMMRGLPDEGVAEMIRSFAEVVPVDTLASLVASKTRAFTPEHIESQIVSLTGKLPRGASLAEAFHDAAAAASKGFAAISEADDFGTARAALQDMISEARAALFKGFTSGDGYSPAEDSASPKRRRNPQVRKTPSAKPSVSKGKGGKGGGNFKM